MPDPFNPRVTRLLILLPSVLSVAALLAAWVWVENFLPDDENSLPLLHESWDILSIDGVRVGGSHTRQWQTGHESQPRKVTESNEYLHVLRQGQAVHLEVTYRCEETLTGELLICYSRQQTSGGPPIVQTVQVVGSQLQLRLQMESGLSTRTIDWPPNAHGYFGIERSLRQKMLVPDERRTLKYLVPLLNQIAEVELHATQFETIELVAGLSRLLHIDVSTHREGITTHRTLWCDGAGEVIRSYEPTMKITSERTSREVAQWKGPTPQYDIMIDSLVPIDPPIGSPLEQTELIYQVRLRDSSPAKIFAQDDRQTIHALDNRQALLSVRSAWLGRNKGDGSLLPERPRPTLRVGARCFAQKTPVPLIPPESPPEAATLAPSRYIQSDDPEIIALAGHMYPDTGTTGTGISGTGTTGTGISGIGKSSTEQLAIGLEQLVFDWIHDKSYQQVFATAREVFQSHRGDCTEHAVLLAAVCRARKLPARLAVGLIYVPELQGFLFHMWTEVWWDKQWHGLDATLGQSGIGATHLKLHAFTLANDNPLAEMAAVIQVIGQLKIRVAEE